jgi:hypothetical protein
MVTLAVEITGKILRLNINFKPLIRKKLREENEVKKKPPYWVAFLIMVGRARLERATNWLKANCSTN